MTAWPDTKLECLSSLIWKKCPKDVSVGRKVLELGVFSAVIQFN